MRRVLLFLASLAWIGAGCGRSEVAKPTNADGGAALKAAANADELVIGEPIKYANLTIFPISSGAPKLAGRFITLDEGLKSGKVEIWEVGSWQPPQLATEAPRRAANVTTDDPFARPSAAPGQGVAPADENTNEDIFAGGPDVNRLLVVNRADKPLYLMPGEIIIGGQQDRAVGRECVIAPSEKPVPIEVFCVEHGRWNDRVSMETVALLELANSPSPVADSVAIAGGEASNLSEVARQTSSGKFVGSVGNVNKAARLAVQGEKHQGAVWDRVAQTNDSSGISAATGAFTANYTAPATIEQLEPYIMALSLPIAEHSQIVGVMVAVNGHVETMDVFESTPLFLALWPKLLKSYALDAANAPEKDVEKQCPRDDAQEFLAKATAAPSKTEGGDENLIVTSRSADDVVCFSAHDKTSTKGTGSSPSGGFGGLGAGMGGGMGGFGGSVHTSAF